MAELVLVAGPVVVRSAARSSASMLSNSSAGAVEVRLRGRMGEVLLDCGAFALSFFLLFGICAQRSGGSKPEWGKCTCKGKTKKRFGRTFEINQAKMGEREERIRRAYCAPRMVPIEGNVARMSNSHEAATAHRQKMTVSILEAHG